MVITICEQAKDFKDIKPMEFYDLACELEQIKNDLSSTNASVNRTIYMRIYYSVFLFLREWLEIHTDYVSNPNREHKRLANYIKYRGPFSKSVNEDIYDNLVILKKLRHQADYKLVVPIKYSTKFVEWDFTSISSAFEIAENILELFNESNN